MMIYWRTNRGPSSANRDKSNRVDSVRQGRMMTAFESCHGLSDNKIRGLSPEEIKIVGASAK
jgi:hypothetical protein